jgi:class 3 adenylate cyclase
MTSTGPFAGAAAAAAMAGRSRLAANAVVATVTLRAMCFIVRLPTRLCAAADEDHILVSRHALQAAGLKSSGLRELNLKGIKEPIEAAEVSWTD